MNRYNLLLLLSTLLLVEGFTPLKPLTMRRAVTPLFVVQESDVEEIRHEIEDMRKEALERMEALNAQLVETLENTKPPVAVEVEPEKKEEKPRVTATSDKVATATPKKKKSKSTPAQRLEDRFGLLHDTRWKVVLNIGREPGTWMPAEFGASGERLYLNFEVDFLSDQLYENDQDEFLGGLAGAKVLEVVNDELTMGPSLDEDQHKIRVKKTGGYTIAPGEGPCSTDLLRFYLELEEEARHHGTVDVWCPKGRVYCTCGYFPMHGRKTGCPLKESIHEEQLALAEKYEQLDREQREDTSLMSLTKMKRAKELVMLRIESDKLKERMKQAQVREPDKAMLRLSRDGNVGLTMEGGVCCRVQKGLAAEYHILGKFGIGALEKREEPQDDDAKDRLMP